MIWAIRSQPEQRRHADDGNWLHVNTIQPGRPSHGLAQPLATCRAYTKCWPTVGYIGRPNGAH